MTTELFQKLRDVSDALGDHGLEWALVGGLAVSAYVEPRFTRDIDVAVAVKDDAHAETVIHAWLGRGFVIDTIVEQDDAERLATARTHEPGESEGIVVDLLFASSGIEPEIAAAAEPLELAPGLVVPVAQPGHLFVLKLLARDPETRPQDDIDLRNLAEILSKEDIELARSAAALIEARQFSRGRDLSSAIDEWT